MSRCSLRLSMRSGPVCNEVNGRTPFTATLCRAASRRRLAGGIECTVTEWLPPEFHRPLS